MDVYDAWDYERRGDFNALAAQREWLTEEAEERQRQEQVRWEFLERSLPAGTKCAPRLEHERKMQEQQQAALSRREDQRRRLAEARAQKAQQAVAQGVPHAQASGNPFLPAPAPAPVATLPASVTSPNNPFAPRPHTNPFAAEPHDPFTPHPLAAVPSSTAPMAASADATLAQDRSERLRLLAERRAVSAPPEPALEKPAPASDNIAAVEHACSRLESHALALSRVDHGKDGFDRDFAALDAEDRRNFSLQLCIAATHHPELNRYDDILPYDR